MALFPRRILAYMTLAAISSTFTCTNDLDNYLGNTYRSVASYNIQNFLNALSLGACDEEEPFFDALRKHDEEYIYTSKQEKQVSAFSFKPNEEFNYETMLGRYVQSNMSIVGAILFEKQQDLKGNLVYIVRRFCAKYLTVVMKSGNVTASRFYMLDKKWPTQPANSSSEEESDESSTEKKRKLSRKPTGKPSHKPSSKPTPKNAIKNK